MTLLSDYALHLLRSQSLTDKLTDCPEHIILDQYAGNVADAPGREPRLKFSDKKMKIPRLEHLHQEHNRAVTMHHFANHELMAIELFAWALLKFPELPERFKKDILKTISEEQKHLRLYLQQMQIAGISLGDRPLNYIFWKQTPRMQTAEKFFAVMALSLEGANLDYSILYEKAFRFHGDNTAADIMQTIYRDELKHVTRGLKIFRNFKPDNMNDWEYYLSLIEFPFTPRRAKGYKYFPESRKKTGLDDSFVTQLEHYSDEYSNRVKSSLLNEL